METPEVTISNIESPQLSKGRRIAYILSGMVLTFAFGFMLLVIFWLIYPYKIASIEEPIEVLNPNNEVAVGENLRLEVRVTKYDEIYPDRSEYITCNDGSLTFIDPGTAKIVPPGKYVIVNDDNVISPGIHIGSRCRFHFQYTYKVNPIRNVIKEWDSEEFLVLRGETHNER